MTYTFRRATEADLPLIRGWLAQPHVAEWWDDPEELDEAFDDDPHTRLWIVELDGRPFAYMQDYDPHAWPGHHFSHLPSGSRGIDQYIGEPGLLNQGHGSAFVKAHVERMFADGVPAVGVDPAPHNPRAIRAYEKAGFAGEEVVDTDWGVSRLMVRWPELSAN